jgi:hypothetical protein
MMLGFRMGFKYYSKSLANRSHILIINKKKS